MGEQIGDALVPDPVAVAATVATGGIGRGVLRVAEEAADVGKLGKKARKAAARAAKEGGGVAEQVLPQNLIGGTSSQVARQINPSKAASKAWHEATHFKGELRRSGNEIWAWDKLHNDIEVYDKRGRHLGSRSPTTGELYKPAVPGRRIEL